MNITIDKLLEEIDKGILIKVEKRGIFNYGFPYCHFEIPAYINPADGDPWDVMVFGYTEKFDYDETFHTNKLVGIIFITGGNHKLIFKIPGRKSFSQSKFDKDLRKYMSNYRVNGLSMNYIEF